MKGFDVDPIAIWASDAPEASISSKESDTPKKYYFLIEYLSFFFVKMTYFHQNPWFHLPL